MQRFTETMEKSKYEKDYKKGVKDWGDQVDVVVEVSEPVKIEDSTIYNVTFMRCTKQEYEATDREAIIEKAKNDEYNDVAFLRKKIENQAKAINLLIEIMEEEDE